MRTESGTPAARNAAQTDPDLALITDAWPDLPDDVKRNIVHVVRSCRPADPDTRRRAVRDSLKQAHSDARQNDRRYPGRD